MVFLAALALVWLIVASVQDWKKREVYNWLSFSLIIFALLFRAVKSVLFSTNDFYYGFLGFIVFFILANLLYYARFFAGGDAKLFMALGAVIGMSFEAVVFIFLVLFVGAAYSLIYSVFMLRKGFFKGLKKHYTSNRGIFNLSLVGSLFFLIIGLFVHILFLVVALLFLLFPFLYVYAKVVEEFMIKEVRGINLSEGDWLAQDVRVGKTLVKSNWEGLNKDEVKLLRGKKRIKIKQGIPFVPVFLISFILLALKIVFFD